MYALPASDSNRTPRGRPWHWPGVEQLVPRAGERFAFPHREPAGFLLLARQTDRKEQALASETVRREIIGQVLRIERVGLAPPAVAV